MIPFIPQGPSVVLAYADDSTDTSVTLDMGALGVPNVLYVVNPDTANVVVVNVSFDPLDTNASVPTSGANGVGTVIAPFGYAMIGIDSHYRTGNIYLSAAGDSATGNVFVTPGVTQYR
jgi:hypothetical protein